MSFLIWHYTYAQDFYFRRYKYHINWISHYFSLPVLAVSIFSPYKRLIVADNTSGFNLQKAFEVMSYNLVSRFMGAIVRSCLLVAGTIAILLTAILGALAYPLWLLFPPLSFGLYLRYTNNPENVSKKIWLKMSSTQDPLSIFLASPPGIFMSSHINLTADELASIAQKKPLVIIE